MRNLLDADPAGLIESLDPAYRTPFEARLARLSAAELDVLRLAALLGTEVPQSVVVHCSGLAEPALRAALESARAEVLECAREIGEPDLAFLGLSGLITAQLESGDLASLEEMVPELEVEASRLDTPFALSVVAGVHTMLDMMRGRLDEAEQRLVAATTSYGRFSHPEIAAAQGVQLVYLRSESGRLGELQSAARDFERRVPDMAAWSAGLLLIYEATDQTKQLEHGYRHLVERLDRISRDRHWMVVLAILAELSAKAAAPDLAVSVYTRLLPFTGQNVVCGRAYLYYGSVDLSSRPTVSDSFQARTGTWAFRISGTPASSTWRPSLERAH